MLYREETTDNGKKRNRKKTDAWPRFTKREQELLEWDGCIGNMLTVWVNRF